jgi:uncharacterized membrane protein
MNRRLVDALLLVLLALPLAYLWFTAPALPVQMASHFNDSGAANGFAPRQQYLQTMALLSGGMPLLLGIVLPALFSRTAGAINLPHREYWLAPERQESSFAYLRTQFRWFAIVLAAFMTFMHALVVKANGVSPPQLNISAAQTGVVIFLVATVLWVAALLLHFRRPR